jgi:hypothetical protein
VHERRKNFRVEWNAPARMYDKKGRFTRFCVVSNFSNGGAKIVSIDPKLVPKKFLLRISPHGRPHQCQVVWRSKDGLGVQFVRSDRAAGAPTSTRTKKLLPKYVG